MTADQVKKRIGELAAHFTFRYQGISCGVDPLSRTYFDVWCGDEQKVCKNLDEVMDVRIFRGRSLSDICDAIEIIDW